MFKLIKEQIKEISLNTYRKLFTVTSYTNSKLDRISFDNIVSLNTNDRVTKRDKLSKISAVIRVKNGAEYIEASILSIAPLVSEIIIVDNNSSDETVYIANKLKKQLQDICEINIYEYKNKLELAGNGYLKRVKLNPEGSLADFYNYSFGLAKNEYVIKWDAHAIMFEHAIDKIQNILTKKNPDSICFRGLEFYGKKLNIEMRMYKKDLNLIYFDSELYEMIDFKYKKYEDITKIYFQIPFYLHMKRLSYIKFIKTDNLIKEKYK